jgi:dipeptidase D
MSRDIRELEPKDVWHYFYEITQIPHPSKHEGRIVDFMVKFGKDLGLETIVDAVGNVIIRKPATLGCENKKGIVLQGHLDMVPQANNDTKHNFLEDPIDTYIDGDWVTAQGTTLGADNGMGVAAIMAVLASDKIKHGPIEALFTIDEETGMTGAFALKSGVLQGDILLNLDSEDEGELCVGCAGGVDGNFYFSLTFDEKNQGVEPLRISVKGLKGGHSGVDINLERGNANKILFRLLQQLLNEFDVQVVDIDGGSLRNAIPREAYIDILVSSSRIEELYSHIDRYKNIIKAELSSVDPDVDVLVEKVETAGKPIAHRVIDKLTKAINGCPNGVIRMSMDMEGLVETSSNLAVVKLVDGEVVVQCLLRSSVDTSKEDLANSIGSVFSLADARVEFNGEYPGWKPNMQSEILQLMTNVYVDLYSKQPEIRAVHAGLECGLLGGTYPNWDMISFGPTIKYPHSPDEKIEIESVVKFYKLLVETLEKI